MGDTPIYDALAKKYKEAQKAKSDALKPKKAPVGKETGITKTKAQTKANAKGKTPTQRIKRGK